MPESLSAKRSRLETLIRAHHAARLRAAGYELAGPGAYLAALERNSRTLATDIAGMPEAMIDQLLKRYDTSAYPRHVW